MVSASGLSENLKVVPSGSDFTWEDVRKEFTWYDGGVFNIAYECIDKWVKNRSTRENKALIFIKDERILEYSFLQVQEISSQWANMFLEQGITIGDRILLLLPSTPELYFALLGCARIGAVFSILSSDLAYQELEHRILDSSAKAIVISSSDVDRLPAQAVETLNYIFVIDGPRPLIYPQEINVEVSLQGLPKHTQTMSLAPLSPLFITYISGGTAPPKGIIHAHTSMLGYWVSGKLSLNALPGSIIWSDAGPSTISGLICGTFAPWIHGAAIIGQGNHFSAPRWYATLEKHNIGTWHTSPFIIRELMAEGLDLPVRYNLAGVSQIITSGDSLQEEEFTWIRKVFQKSPYEVFIIPETDMICIGNRAQEPIRVGSLGKPVEGINALIVGDEGELLPEYTLGELAFSNDLPNIMTGIWNDVTTYRSYFKFPGLFLTGHLAYRDRENRFFAQGRKDDLIRVGDRFLGPYEIEQALMLHPYISAAAVCATAEDKNPGFKAYVEIHPNFNASTKMEQEILQFVRCAYTTPPPLRSIVFLHKLPRGKSGRILRRALSAMDLGLPLGNTSNLEDW